MPNPNSHEKEGQFYGSNPSDGLEQHYPSNPGVLLGHETKDLTAVHGREAGKKDPPGPGGPPKIFPD